MVGSKYVAERTLGYYIDQDGKMHRKTVKRSFERKKDAVAALPTLAEAPRVKEKNTATFGSVYALWFETLSVGKDTQNCYKAAWKYFAPLHSLFAAEVDIDDLQECMDECPFGKRTRQNMKTVAGLVYKYGIPRGYFPEKLNLAQFLRVSGDEGAGGVGLPMDYVERIAGAVDTVRGADLVLCQCFLGFRPAEFLALSRASYNADEKVFIGGAKTAAGRNRAVTVAPFIQPIVDRYAALGNEQFFSDGTKLTAEAYRALFYSVLDQLGLDNPTTTVAGTERHRYTPHSCRHTFASLMKRSAGSDKDKQALIGHTSAEMLRYYQDAPLEDLRKITDQLRVKQRVK